MRLRSVGLKTELGLAATQGKLADRGDYVVVRTPDNPGYYFGNFLVLAEPLRELAPWLARFADEFRDDTQIQHVAFRWDSTDEAGAIEELRAARFDVQDDFVMTATEVSARPIPYEIRPLLPHEMQVVADLAFSISDDHSDKYRRFLNRRATWQRLITDCGLGTFWGAFDGSQLVGSLGLVTLDRLARYQDVQTAPAYRKRGIASALLARAAAAAFEVERYVIIAEPSSDASRVYARAGFTVLERMVSAFRRPASR